MKTIKGYKILAIMPVLKNDGNMVDGYIIAGERELMAMGYSMGHETMTGWVSTLDATEWCHGHYFHSPRAGEVRRKALHDAMFRASLTPTPKPREAV